MMTYSKEMAENMLLFCDTLNEIDRRRYAAIEAMKFGHGGIEYISEILLIDRKTIKKGIKEVKKKLSN